MPKAHRSFIAAFTSIFAIGIALGSPHAALAQAPNNPVGQWSISFLSITMPACRSLRHRHFASSLMEPGIAPLLQAGMDDGSRRVTIRPATGIS